MSTPAHSRTHSVHGHTFAPLHHHRTGSSVATLRHAAHLKRLPVAEELPGGNKVTEYPFNKVMDHPYTGYLILLAILAALMSLLFLK